MFADKRYHNYFYGVPPEFATPERPAFRAEGGYSGLQALTTISRRSRNWWIGGFARWDTLAGATIEDSPLTRQKNSFAAGMAVTWTFKRSARLTTAEE
jgi:outer membrane scaffolding protein for murein synthesis (MipA/OmpV family)